MAARLSKIYTKTGDDGTTAVRAEVRLSKSDPLIELIGSLDELNSMIGELISLPIENGVDEDENENEHKHYNTLLFNIQHQLFNLGGELCMPEYPGITQKDIQFLETEIDAFNTQLPPLKEFILPGGSMKAAKCLFLLSWCLATLWKKLSWPAVVNVMNAGACVVTKSLMLCCVWASRKCAVVSTSVRWASLPSLAATLPEPSLQLHSSRNICSHSCWLCFCCCR